MFLNIFILVFGFILLVVGANYLIKGACNIAKRFEIPEVLIGLTIVALGTSLPELVITILSAISHNPDIVVGNIIGSNICNLLLILGFICILKPIKFEKNIIRFDLPLLITIALIILFMELGLLSENKLILNKLDSLILLSIALIYFLIPIKKYIKIKKEPSLDYSYTHLNNAFKDIIYIIFSCFALKFGGDFVVKSSTNISYILNISERIIGLTIVSLGTSLPELITSIISIMKRKTNIAEGNIIGSCIINLTLGLGISSFISTLHIELKYIIDLILLFGSTLLIWLYSVSNKNNSLTRKNGFILVFMYITYSIYLFLN